ncbi:hypothetical protein FA95DRAFT_1578491, partial [Auriscalpium vulgare]
MSTLLDLYMEEYRDDGDLAYVSDQAGLRRDLLTFHVHGLQEDAEEERKVEDMLTESDDGEIDWVDSESEGYDDEGELLENDLEVQSWVAYQEDGELDASEVAIPFWDEDLEPGEISEEASEPPASEAGDPVTDEASESDEEMVQ